MPVTSGSRTVTGLPAGMQQITFAIEQDEDLRFKKWILITPTKGRTIAQVAARRGHPEDAGRIAKKNGVRSIYRVLWKKGRKAKYNKRRIWVPGELKAAFSFHALAGDNPPKVTQGYAKFEVVARPERVGLTTFDGYDPIQLTVPIRFEAKTSAAARQVEEDIDLLERMAGRGNFEGAAVGPPPIVRITTTDGQGNMVPLIPRNYQRSAQNKAGPLWHIQGIDWDDGALRNRDGNRVRQLATVTVMQHTRVKLATRSVTERIKTKKKPPKKGK